MSLPESFLDDLRSRVSVSSVVGRRVKLVRKGREHEGLCPFHNEKTPSFTVNEDKGFFHCFGCGAHGDAIAFEQRVGNLTFTEAVERLAADAGMEVPKATPEERETANRRATLLDALEAACAWFEAQLRRPAGAEGLAYLQDRAVFENTIADFRLGWAPDSRDGLGAALRAKGFGDDLLIEAGLRRKNPETGTVADMFRGRVVFPIRDRRGRVVGFGARTLGDGKPKYLNSPETPVFHKGALLYGLAEAAPSAAKRGEVLVAEGYMDVIALHQAGFDHAVAPLGTALTGDQLEELWRLCDVPVLCLDGDEAGQRAMERAAERALPLLRGQRSLRFAMLPAKDDPDSLIRGGGAAAMERVLDAAAPLADALWDMAIRTQSPTTPEREAALERLLFGRACLIPDARLREAYLRRFRLLLEEFMWPPPPPLLMGRSKKRTAPRPGGNWLSRHFERMTEHETMPAVRDYLAKRGVDWDGLVARLGGVGFIRAKLLKGKWVEGRQWWVTPPVPLWEPEDPDCPGVGLVVLPVMDERPDGEARIVDLIGWDVRGGKVHARTGAAVVLGRHLLDEAVGFEGQGLSHPLHVVGDPLVWLRRYSRGERVVCVVDWGRVWQALGGLGELVADSLELGEMLEKHVRVPVPSPRISVDDGQGADAVGEGDK